MLSQTSPNYLVTYEVHYQKVEEVAKREIDLMRLEKIEGLFDWHLLDGDSIVCGLSKSIL